jgi:hypothetical protein
MTHSHAPGACQARACADVIAPSGSVSADPNGSAVKWVGKYDAKGAPDTDAKIVIDGIYEAGEKGLVGG